MPFSYSRFLQSWDGTTRIRAYQAGLILLSLGVHVPPSVSIGHNYVLAAANRGYSTVRLSKLFFLSP